MTFSDPGDQYVFDERIAILTDGPRKPTDAEIAMAIGDVWRFRRDKAKPVKPKLAVEQFELLV